MQFTIVANRLNRLFGKAKEINLIHGFKVRREGVEISHLHFVDNTTFLWGPINFYLKCLEHPQILRKAHTLRCIRV